MIFYFSGTGNSLHVAKALQEHFGSELIDMAKANRDKAYAYRVVPGERVFIVFPVYFSGLPGAVSEFIQKMQLQAEGEPEIIGVVTYGGYDAGSGRQLMKALKQRGLRLRAFYGAKAPENCIFFFNPPLREAALAQLKHMNDRVKDIIDSVDYHHRMPDSVGAFQGALASAIHHFYACSCKTGKFHVTDACISCGLCERVCPVQAIRLKDGHPVWVADTCLHCTACINRCPENAIEYGKGTRNRNRYTHPDLGKKYTIEKQR